LNAFDKHMNQFKDEFTKKDKANVVPNE